MADGTIGASPAPSATVPLKLRDNGDTTFSLYGASLPVVVDAAGAMFSPASCAHVYAYSGAFLLTDTATDPVTAVVRVKTFVNDGTRITSESAWT